MKLNLKLRPGATSGDIARVMDTARAQGVVRAEPLFPDSSVTDLRSLFVLEAPDSSDCDRLVEALSADDCVQFVEPEPSRTLLR